jgi:exodeoxyribonuclease V alpha subunit
LLRAGLARLFPAGEAESVDWQRVAAALAVLRPFCVICGGPGTGKTHTVAAILALLLEQAGARPLRVALAAPTGKAAGRLRDAIHAARPGLDISPELAAGFPDEALTLHRLLGFRPGRSCPRYGPQEPLSADLVVVDEASMVDLPMMARLVDALPANARLILLGDRDQLASVAPGMVLADIAGRNVVAGYSPRLRQALAEVGAASLEQAPQVPARLVLAPLADHVVLLRRSWRFAAGGALGVLAQAINSGNPDAALAVLQQPGGQVQLLPPCDATLDQLISMLLLPAWRQVLAAADPQAALVAAARVRLLAAVREGPWGVVALNRRVERALAAAGLLRGGGAWYAGRPVMVTVNDHAQNLYNGDVGMALPDAVSAAPRVWFASGAGVRSVPPARLPPHETVYAMTVHKSQGSEFQQVVLVLPPAAGASVTRELLYTAVTRARDAVTVVGTPEVFAAGVEHRIDRSTGLQAALWGTGVVSGPSPG